MSPRTTISLAVLAVLLLAGLLLRSQLRFGGSGGSPSTSSTLTDTTPHSVQRSHSPGARPSLAAIPPSGDWSPEVEEADMFNGSLECPPALYEQGFALEELPRFKELLAEFRGRVIAVETEIAEVIEKEDGVGVQLDANEESAKIANWFTDQLGQFQHAEKLGAKYLDSETYTDLTEGVRTIWMEVGPASEWVTEAIVLSLSRQTRDGSGSNRRNLRIEPDEPFQKEFAKRYRHVIDIPATVELVGDESGETPNE